MHRGYTITLAMVFSVNICFHGTPDMHSNTCLLVAVFETVKSRQLKNVVRHLLLETSISERDRLVRRQFGFALNDGSLWLCDGVLWSYAFYGDTQDCTAVLMDVGAPEFGRIALALRGVFIGPSRRGFRRCGQTLPLVFAL